MARVGRIQHSFNAGELSPRLEGRIDIDKYQAGLKTCLNWLPTPAGSVYVRPGTRFVSEVANSSNASALYRFVFSNEDAYILEFSGSGVMRIVREDANGVPGMVLVQDQSVDLDDPDTVDLIAETIFIPTGHGFTDGFGPVHVASTGTLPTGLTAATDYFVRLFPTFPFASTDVDTVNDNITLNGALAASAKDGWGPYRIALGATPVLGDRFPNPIEPLSEWWFNVVAGPAAELFSNRELRGTRLDIVGAGSGGANDLLLEPTPEGHRLYLMLAATASGAPINMTAAGSGVMTITQQTAAPVVTYAHPYAETEIFDLKIRQSGDTLFVTHPNHRPQVITRLSHDSWVIDRMDLFDGPYQEPLPSLHNAPHQNIYEFDPAGINTGRNKGGTSQLNLTNGEDLWSIDDVGGLVTFENINPAPKRTWGVFLGPSSATNNDLIHMTRFDATGDQSSIRLQAFGDQSDRGWPRACSFFEERFVLAGTFGDPQVLYFSVTGDFFTFSPTVLGFDGTNWPDNANEVIDTSAIVAEIASDETSTILWMRQHKGRLLAGTNSGVYRISGNVGEGITPFNVLVRQIASDGANDADAVSVENLLVYVSRSEKLVIGVGFQLEEDELAARDLTLLADHIAGTGIAEVAYSKEPDRLIWCRRRDGTLACLTLWDSQEVSGWSRHQIAGTGPGGTGVPQVESINSIPSIHRNYDSLYLVVRRRINGADVRYIERFEPKFIDTDAAAEAWTLDSALEATSGLPATVIAGLSHLEGQSVYAVRDGIVDGPHTVASGQITLGDEATSRVIVGLRYDADLEILRVIAPQPDGSGQGRAKAIRNLIVRVHRSFGGQVGPDFDNLRPLLRRKLSDDVNGPAALQTLDHEVDGYDGGVSGDPRVAIRQHLPLPFTLLALIYDAEVGGRPGGGA